jgi:imidazole glycerol-phosphate synthase subunit HisH
MRPHRGSSHNEAAGPTGQLAGRQRAHAVRIGIVDYGAGNRRSVEKALERAGARPVLTRDPDTLAAADGLVVPGVGAFAAAMQRLRATGMDAFLVERARAGVPVLGLCLGMQLLFERSTELGGDEGLGLLQGDVVALAPDDPSLKVPHIGWNVVTFTGEHPLLEGLGGAAAFYHVHSFVARPEREDDILGRGDYGGPFVSIVGRDQIFGAQFHPEKSSAAGLRLLTNFSALCARTPA